MRPIEAILALEVHCNLYSGPLYRKGVELSSNDRATVVDVYQQWLCLFLDLCFLNSVDFLGTAKRLFRDLISRDVLETQNIFTELLYLVRDREPKGFKGLCRRISPHLHCILREDMVLCVQGSTSSARKLVQLFSYTGRLSLKDLDLMDECLADYRATESHIVDLYPDDLVHELNTYVRSWMKTFDPTNLRPKHGSGAVADVPSVALGLKYRSLSSDQLIEYAYGEPYWIMSSTTSYERISKTIFVPKSYKTFRTISMEPATLQYLQQGVLREIDRVVGSSYFLRTRIGTHDQTRNQRLARLGSIRRNYATIDLSAASDSVSYALVKRVFRGTKLLRFLVATRSPRTALPDGTTLDLRKFAPMGSALCFPVMTILLASVCQYVTLRHGVPGTYSCYGDDLVVPTQCVQDLMNVLLSLGFRVNYSKSYFTTTSWFRESCGIECCDGDDVTPLRVSRKYAHHMPQEDAVSLIKLSNVAFERGYRYLRSFFLRRLFHHIPSVMFGPTSLLSDEDTNFHLKEKWHQGHQTLYVRTKVLKTTYGDTDEVARYRHWLESTHERKSDALDSWGHYRPMLPLVEECFRSETGRPTVKLKGAWVVKPYSEIDNLRVMSLLLKLRVKP